MNPNEVLSEKLRVKKIQSEERIVFQLMNAFKKDHGREGNTVPEVYALSKQCSVVDPYAVGGPRSVMIGNVESVMPQELPDGKTLMKPVLKPVEFIRGFCVLNQDKMNTYFYLMRRKDNDSNPFRMIMGGRSKQAVFKLVEDKKEISNQLMLEDLRYEAEKLVRETRDVLKLKAIAEKLNKSPDQRLWITSYRPGVLEDSQAIKLDLIQRVKTFPKAIIYASGDQQSMLRVQIHEALNFGVLMMENSTYYLIGKDLKELYKPSPDEEKIESLIKYFMSAEGNLAYAEFSKTLKEALKTVGSIVNQY